MPAIPSISPRSGLRSPSEPGRLMAARVIGVADEPLLAEAA